MVRRKIVRRSTSLVPNNVWEGCDSIARELKGLGVDYVGHGVVCNEGHHTGYFSNFEWGERYFRNGYFFVEPILDVLEQDILNFVHWDALRYESDKHAVAIQRYHMNQITAGFTIASDRGDHKEYLNLGFKTDGKHPQQIFSCRKLVEDYFYAFRKVHTLQRV